MGNNPGGKTIKVGKTLSDEEVIELSSLSGFTPEKVREWHSGFMVGEILCFFFQCIFRLLLLKRT